MPIINFKIVMRDNDKEEFVDSKSAIDFYGLFDIDDKQGNKLFDHFFDSEGYCDAFAYNDDIDEWLNWLADSTLALLENSEITAFFCYDFAIIVKPYIALTLENINDNILISNVLFWDDEYMTDGAKTTLPDRIEIDKNLQPINFNQWCLELTENIDQFIKEVIQREDRLSDNIYINRLKDKSKQIKQVVS